MAVLGLLALHTGLVVMLLLPAIRYASWLMLAMGIILLSAAFIIDFKKVHRALTGRRGRLGVSSLVMAAIFIGIIIVANAISIGNYHRFDVTGLAQFTLASQTKEALGKLKTPVQILIFRIPGEPIGEYSINLLNEYRNYTSILDIKIIDPAENPDMARQSGTTEIPASYRYPAIIFKGESGSRMVKLPDFAAPVGERIVPVQAEHVFTSAILEVTGIMQRKLYFLTGHGEGDLSAEYSIAGQELLNSLFKVETLNLKTTPNIPEDCAALIIVAPQGPLAGSEIDIIQSYLEGHGKALILIEPNPPQEINQLLSVWGVETEDGTVIDPSSYVSPNKHTSLVTRERNFFGSDKIYFPGPTAIIPREELPPTVMTREPLFWTTKQSWLEKSFDFVKEPEYDEGIDRMGPLALGVFITSDQIGEDEQRTALIVIGDSDFASNAHFYNGDNGGLFLKAVGALTVGTEIVSIEHKILPYRRLIVGPEADKFINFSSVGLLPLLVLVIGGVIWWRRR